MKHIALGLVLSLGLAIPSRASAQTTEEDWPARYEAARVELVGGRYREAGVAFRALEASARTEGDRELASEMARLADEYRVQREGPTAMIRSKDEITLLYTSAFLYGAGSGVWFLLETRPDSAATATLPFAAITAAPVVAVATIDGYRKLPRGVPHAISAGLYLGLGDGIFVVGAEHGRWSPETTAGVLWGGATLGATVGGVLGSTLVTTPGRVSFTASTTIWSGAITGFAAGAILPDGPMRDAHAFEVGAAGYNLGLGAGLLFAGDVSPSVARVRLVDLLGAAGGLTAAGLYLSIASRTDLRAAEGLAAGGALVGLSAGWFLTRHMAREEPDPRPPPIAVEPSFGPTRGGGTIGLTGVF